MDFAIREMTEADWPEVSRIYQQGIDSNLATFETVSSDYDEWDQIHLKICRLVITAFSKVVGWASLMPVSNRCCYSGVAEVSIYIDADFRGMGAGELLMKELISLSEDSGIWSLRSGIMENNHASIRVHEKCGFRMVGYLEKIALDRYGNWRNVVLMEKRRRDIRIY